MRKSKYRGLPTVPLLQLAKFFWLIMLLAAPNMYGAVEAWSSCRGPEGAVIDALAIDPLNPAILYAGMDADGVYKSTDGGLNWTAINNGLANLNIRVLVLHPQGPTTIYAGTSTGGVFKSTDGGDSWSAANSGLANLNLRALAVNPQNPAIIFAATSTGGVFKSTNGGENWNEANSGLSNLNGRSLAIDIQSPATMFVGTQGGGIFKSTDSGESWKAILSGLSYKNFQTIALDPRSPEILYAGTDSGAYKSTNSGRSWSAIVDGLDDINVLSFAVDPQISGVVYAGTNSGGVYKSANYGELWSAVNAGIIESNVRTLATDPHNSTIVYAGTNGGGVYKSTNSGDRWGAASGGLVLTNVWTLSFDPASPLVLYAGVNGRGVFKSTNGCASWSIMNSGLTNTSIFTLAIDQQNSDIIYAGAYGGGVFKSTDGGANWEAVNNGLASLNVWTLALDSQDSAVVYAGINSFFGGSGGVYKSVDGGANWSAINSGLTNTTVYALKVNPQNSAILYAGTFGGGVFKSTDGGTNWSAINSGLTNRNVWTLAIDPQNPAIVYAGSIFGAGGVFRSTDGGSNWSAVNSGLTNTTVYSLTIDPQNTTTVYAGTSSGGVFGSTNSGTNWFSMNSGMPGVNVWALAVDPATPRRIFAGANSRGAYVYGPVCSTLTIGSGGTAACKTTGGNGTMQTGYAVLAVNSGSTPYGTAVFSFKQDGVTVTEAGVPASPPTTQARLFIDYRAAVKAIPGRNEAGVVDINTGIAVVNLSSFTANVTYTLRNMNGDLITTGTGTITARKHFARFINQFSDIAAGFNLPAGFQNTIQFGSLEIVSDRPLSVLALRMTTNQRGEILFTTLPVADLTAPVLSGAVFNGLFPQFADGGGYTTSLILLNTSNATETGTLHIMDNSGAALIVNQVGGTVDSSFNYSIPAGGAFRFQTDGSPAEAKVGWIQLIPSAGQTPIGSGIFSYNPSDALISESGIPAARSTTHARVYVDLSANHNTGLAIANIQNVDASILISAFQKDGITAVGTSRGPLQLTPNGHESQFANQFVSGLPADFTGVLDISSTTPFAALTLRSLYNERDEFLMTAFPIADANQEAPSPIVFPQIADEGGYATEFIMLSPQGASSTTLNLFDEAGTPLP
jgi:photosystem II stability/assembly factor-like uncharacterized protein